MKPLYNLCGWWERRSCALSSVRSWGGQTPAKSSGNLLYVVAWRLTLTTLSILCGVNGKRWTNWKWDLCGRPFLVLFITTQLREQKLENWSIFQFVLRFSSVFQLFPMFSNFCLGFSNFPMFWRSWQAGSPLWLKTSKILENLKTLSKKMKIFEIIGKHGKT